ncbi:MAG: TSUP family transporter, partial [Pseudolabrys sp.]|nr:TSUP family transporter [Pseudolabrys sp.]
MTFLLALLTIGSGSLVGFTLGLVGGGGSILAVPLLVYVVGVPSPHVAIGTSALAVAAGAAANLAGHARAHTVKWPCALVFALSGTAGAAGGAHLGKLVDGTRLLT